VAAPIDSVEVVDVVPFALRFREPYVTARGALEQREMALVRIRDSDGVEGLGEAVPLSLRGGASLKAVVAELGESGGGVADAMSSPARAALAMAHLDLRGKRDGAPAWRLLGATSSSPVPCNATLSAGKPEAVAAQAARWEGLGFETFKLKVGMPGDVAQVEAVRAAVGPEARLRVDANGAWTTDEAILKLGAMEQFSLELAEQPAAGLEELALVRGRTAIPIAADESVSSPAEAERAVELGACALATVKLAKVGGFEAARAIAAQLPVYLSSALDGPLGIAAAGHLAQALGDSDAGISHGLATGLLFESTIATVEPHLSGGLLHLPDGPGLGVVLDEAALERARL
jgi:L-alanine-DL-glutamate epimerase-like enolase superfamily enzyme